MVNYLKNMATGLIEEVTDEQILKIESDGRNLTFYTTEGEYKYPSSLEDWEVIKFKNGFRLTDRCNLVNLNNVNSVDKYGNIRFYDNDKVMAIVAKIHLSYIETLINGIRLGKNINDIEVENLEDFPSKIKAKILSLFKKVVRNTSKDETTNAAHHNTY